jgi:DNA (cytosine-5)-methyltransferase 1
MLIKHLELFSGIGGFRQAIELLCRDFDLHCSTVGFSEIEPNALSTYRANFETNGEIEIGDIVAFVNEKGNIRDLPDFDLLTGGFPCQAFSMMGKQKGFKDLRGNVFFQIMDIVKIKKPQVILLENVRNLITHNKGATFETVIKAINNAGYKYVYYDVFNSRDFALAQNRNRVYILATKTALPKDFKFDSRAIANGFRAIMDKTSLMKQQYTTDILDKEVDRKYYLSEIIKPTILSDGSKNFKSKSDIDQLVARPLAATMAKMHRACQDNYFSDEFIQCTDKEEYSKRTFTKEELARKSIRRLTPKEAFNLQGFDNVFYENAKKTSVSDSQLYKQAGNAVSVNTVYAILHYLIIEKGILGG